MPNIAPDFTLAAKVVHVAVAVIERIANCQSRPADIELKLSRDILISKRPKDVHQGGFWEFPGGKVECDETVEHALSRELFEELGIHVLPQHMSPLIQIEHDYGDKKVLLDVYVVHEFGGLPEGKEGQPIRWVNEQDLKQYSFPEANLPILAACCLPRTYQITPEYLTYESAIKSVGDLLESSEGLFLFRQPSMDIKSYRSCVSEILNIFPAAKHRMLLSGDLNELHDLCVAGFHLPFRFAASLKERPVCTSIWFGISCHNEQEIEHAEAIGADFITLSPVLSTATHPGTKAMGWERFQCLVKQAKVPTYALGGMIVKNQQQAQNIGAQGIAGIRMFFH